MKNARKWYTYILIPFLLIAAIILFVLDNFNVDVSSATSYVNKNT